MNYRLFARLFYIIVSVFIILNSIIWFSWTKDLADHKRKGGDLLRLGYIQGFVSQRMQAPDLPRHHIEARDFQQQPIDMISVGDSFSIGSSLKVGCYQDHLASWLNISILNIPTQKDLSFHPVTMLVQLINSGYLDRIKPKYVLLQTIEREAVSRLNYGFNLTSQATIEDLEKEFYGHGREITPLDLNRNLRFINNGNWKFIANNIQYHFRDQAFKSRVVISKLKQPFFTSQQGDTLLFHKEDISAVRKASPKDMTAVNNNLNVLADILKSKGISLIFMPVPDKLTLYNPYLKKRSYPKSVFFEELRTLPKRYTFIDTKQILARELATGVQDLYYQDDTHWSWKAPEAIAKCFPSL